MCADIIGCLTNFKCVKFWRCFCCRFCVWETSRKTIRYKLHPVEQWRRQWKNLRFFKMTRNLLWWRYVNCVCECDGQWTKSVVAATMRNFHTIDLCFASDWRTEECISNLTHLISFFVVAGVLLLETMPHAAMSCRTVRPSNSPKIRTFYLYWTKFRYFIFFFQLHLDINVVEVQFSHFSFGSRSHWWVLSFGNEYVSSVYSPDSSGIRECTFYFGTVCESVMSTWKMEMEIR